MILFYSHNQSLTETPERRDHRQLHCRVLCSPVLLWWSWG